MGKGGHYAADRSLREQLVDGSRLSNRVFYGLHASEAPEHTQSPHVFTGYRCGGSYAAHVREGLLAWHTETINAHTVLLNALLVTAVFAWTLTWAPGALPAGGWAPFAVLWLATQVHAPCSVGYHLFMPMGKRVSNLWRRLDVCAIFVASALLTYAMSAFVLPPAAVAALTSAAAALAAFACLRTWGLRPDDSLADSKASHACFVACGVVLYVTPVVMVMAWEVAAGGVVAAATSPGVLCGAGIVTSLALSGIVYSCSWPECQWPGAFDLVGNSHQLMHVGIMVTQCFQWGFLLTYAADHMRH